jgi:ubiquinone/menaquinone biosynthesis C-methylase UbiE
MTAPRPSSLLLHNFFLHKNIKHAADIVNIVDRAMVDNMAIIEDNECVRDSASSEQLQFRSVLPHEPPPRSDASDKGYILLQGSLLPKVNSKKKGESGDGDGAATAGETSADWLPRLNDALEAYFQAISSDKNHQFLPPLKSGQCDEIVVESSSRVRLRFVSFAVSKDLYIYLKQRPICARDIWTAFLDIMEESEKDSTIAFGGKQLQVTHVTTRSLPQSEQWWTYVCPPKFRRLLITPPNKERNPTSVIFNDYDLKSRAEYITQAKLSTRFLYIAGLGHAMRALCLFLDENCASSDEDYSHLAHTIALDAVRDLVRRTLLEDGEEAGNLCAEVWIPNWNKKKMKNEHQGKQKDDSSGMRSVDHCYVGLVSHDVSNKVLRRLVGQDTLELDFQIPCWCLKVGEQQSGSVQLKAPTKDQLFVDWADVAPRTFSNKKNKKGDDEKEEQRKGKIAGHPARPECTSSTSHVDVPGLILLTDFVSQDEERILLATLRGPYAPWAPKQKTKTGLGDPTEASSSDSSLVGLKRRVQHYGYVFDYQTSDVLRDREEEKLGDCPPLPAVPSESSSNGETLKIFSENAIKNLHGWDVFAAIVERARRTSFDVGALGDTTSASSSNGTKGVLQTSITSTMNDEYSSPEKPLSETEPTNHTHPTCTRFPDINQLTVNEYAPGSGIGSHIDTISAFDNGLMSISLNSGIVMEFRERQESKNPTSSLTGRRKLLYLPPRSLVLFSGDARYKWEHMIVSRRTDTVDDEVIPRKMRLSLTLRTALTLNGKGAVPRVERIYGNSQPGECYKLSCKSAGKQQHNNEGISKNLQDDPLKTPETERAHVHEVYDAIAVQWNHTRSKRHALWPKATKFLESIGEGALIADVGCGDGKYFPVAKETDSIIIGTDISIPLLQTSHCADHKVLDTDVLGADCMNLPFMSYSFDGVICIAVMHHLSTAERRKRCIQEINRIVKKGGRVMVQAWALEQNEGSKRDFASSDVFVPFNAQPRYLKKVDVPGEEQIARMHAKDKQTMIPTSEKKENVAAMYSTAYEGADFDEEKGLVVFQRYCHVYRQSELDALFHETGGWEIEESGYEAGNHFIIARSI